MKEKEYPQPLLDLLKLSFENNEQIKAFPDVRKDNKKKRKKDKEEEGEIKRGGRKEGKRREGGGRGGRGGRRGRRKCVTESLSYRK